jgi:hypothetical protein
VAVLVSLFAAGLAATAHADAVSCIASGDWSDPSIWRNDDTSTTPYTPTSADDIDINNYAVAYDLSGSHTFSNIHVRNSSGRFYFKMNDGVADVRELRITGELRCGNDGATYDYARVYIGGSYGGGTIESNDDFRLVFDTDGAELVSDAQRSHYYLQGYSASNQNVKIHGAGGGVYGVIDLSSGRDGRADVRNCDFYNLSQVNFGYLSSLLNCDFYDYEPSTVNAVNAVGTMSNCTFEVVGDGMDEVPALCVDNTFTRAVRGGKCFDLPSYSPDYRTIRNNVVSGFDRAYSLGFRHVGITFEGNTWDNCNYGFYWLASHDPYGDFDSYGDVFGGTTPNAVYDMRIKVNTPPAHFNLDGTVLASDPNPLNELYFEYNNGGRNFIAWRDFDGATGDYRVWSSDDGFDWSHMLLEPRETDVLTVESDQAYSGNTPTKLVLTENVNLAGLHIDTGTVLDLAGYTVVLSDVNLFIAGAEYPSGSHTAASLGLTEVVDSSPSGNGSIEVPFEATILYVF